jgi:periplasmic protein TonB
MPEADRVRTQDRLRAAAAATLFHALIGYGLVTGLNLDLAAAPSATLKVFSVSDEPPPPPIVEESQPVPADSRPEGEAAPPNLHAKPTPVVAPPPLVPLQVPTPLPAAPVALPVDGRDTSAGASDIPGPGTGSGGFGDGMGGGGRGKGPGGGGGGVPAERVRGALVDADYPDAAADVRAEGTVFIRFRVETDGRVRGCTVTRSSGNADLDETTCRLVERRFRYRPARDAQGRRVAESITTNFSWGPRF